MPPLQFLLACLLHACKSFLNDIHEMKIKTFLNYPFGFKMDLKEFISLEDLKRIKKFNEEHKVYNLGDIEMKLKELAKKEMLELYNKGSMKKFEHIRKTSLLNFFPDLDKSDLDSISCLTIQDIVQRGRELAKLSQNK
eukprot:NODE_14_length_51535_cov_1.125049.p40 type:complete len:138 gc:universal NODE_14_length_51535_cov_1.125049:49643-49230(-)